ncbi:MAG: DUF6913 domain-containing protein, partial [Bacteroidia bacterium]
FLNWDKIEKIALILDNAQPINKNELDKFIESTKKYIDVYYLELNSKNPSFADWICFTKKDRTFLNLPKSHVESSIKNRQYQLVINTAEKYPLFAAHLLSQINPPYSCGIQNLFGETDLIVEKNTSVNIVEYLKDVKKYLEMIRTV